MELTKSQNEILREFLNRCEAINSIAVKYLKEADWDLERALVDYDIDHYEGE